MTLEFGFGVAIGAILVEIVHSLWTREIPNLLVLWVSVVLLLITIQ